MSETEFKFLEEQSIGTEGDNSEEKHLFKDSASPAGSYSSKDSNVDANNELKPAYTLKRPKKSYIWIKRSFQSDNDLEEEISTPEEQNNFFLKVSNFPTYWTFQQIKEFILKEYGPLEHIYIGKKDVRFNGVVKLEFSSFTEWRKAFDKFHGKVVEDIKLFADNTESDNEDDQSDTNSSLPKRKKVREEPWRPDIDVWEPDPSGLYGFELEYLKVLGITPPIDKWVHVSNFRCDKSELKEVMELAGEVLICNVEMRGQKTGKIMYAHPIEAVQAVSMLNNQELYGQPLKVTIDRCPVGTVFLPRGLRAVGPGLGMGGKPLRDIVRQYERFVNYKNNFVNTLIFRNPDALFSSSENEFSTYMQKNVDQVRNNSNFRNNFGQKPNVAVTPNTVIANVVKNSAYVPNIDHSRSMPGPSGLPSGSTGPPGPIGDVPLVMLSETNRPIAGFTGMMTGRSAPSAPVAGVNRPMSGPISPMTGPTRLISGPFGIMPRPMSGPSGPVGPANLPVFNIPNARMQMPCNVPQPIGNRMMNPTIANNDNYVVELSNLPMTTTFPLLSEKMAHCGQVLSVQLTSPGCAVVQFAKQEHAERCFQQYNNCLILGNRITVKFL